MGNLSPLLFHARSLAFVEYERTEDARKALKNLNGHLIHNRELKIEVSWIPSPSLLPDFAAIVLQQI